MEAHGEDRHYVSTGPSQVAKEISKQLDTLRVYESQLGNLRKNRVPELDPQMWACKRKMALCCATIAASYTDNPDVELPMSLLQRAETFTDSGDHRSFMSDTCHIREKVYSELDELYAGRGDMVMAMYYRLRRLLIKAELVLTCQHPAVPSMKAYTNYASRSRWKEALTQAQSVLIKIQEQSMHSQAVAATTPVAVTVIAQIQIAWCMQGLNRLEDMSQTLDAAAAAAAKLGGAEPDLTRMCGEFGSDVQQNSLRLREQMTPALTGPQGQRVRPDGTAIHPTVNSEMRRESAQKRQHKASTQGGKKAGRNPFDPVEMLGYGSRSGLARFDGKLGVARSTYDNRWGHIPGSRPQTVSLDPQRSHSKKRAQTAGAPVGSTTTGVQWGVSSLADWARGCNIDPTAYPRPPTPQCTKRRAPAKQARPRTAPIKSVAEASEAIAPTKDARKIKAGKLWAKASKVATIAETQAKQAGARVEEYEMKQKQSAWSAITEDESWVPMGSRCSVGRKGLSCTNMLFSRRLLEHHKPTFLKDICRVSLRTPFSQEDLIEVLVKMSKLCSVPIGEMVSSPHARSTKRHFRKICQEQNFFGGRLGLIDRVFYALTNTDGKAGNTVSFGELIEGFSTLLSGRGMGFDNDKEAPTQEQLRMYFLIYDLNEDNAISRMDLFEGLNQNNNGRHFPPDIIGAINQFFNKFDTDDTGELPFEQFAALVEDPDTVQMFWEFFEYKGIHPGQAKKKSEAIPMTVGAEE